MTIKKVLSLFITIIGLTTLALIVSLLDAAKSVKVMNEAENTRYISHYVTEELKDNSQQLTSAIRQFAVTGDERLADEYLKILQIHDGKAPRPYDHPIAPGEYISSDKLISQIGFTNTELELLQLSNSRYKNLIELATEAMYAAKGLFPDEKGQFTVKGQPDRARAIGLVFGVDYARHYASVFEPFSQFYSKLNTRLDADVSVARLSYENSMGTVWLVLSIIIVMCCTCILLVILLIVKPILMCDKFAREITEGNLDCRLNYSSNNEIGSLADSLRLMLQSLRERISLREQAERFSAVISTVGAGIIIKDKDGVIVDWNKGAQKIMGYTPEEIIGHTSDVYRKEPYGEVVTNLNQRLSNGESVVLMEDTLVHKDGSPLICSTSFSPILNADNVVVGSIIIFHDVTTGNLAEQRSRSLAAIFEIADAGIVIRDKAGVIREWNVGATNILGYRPKEIIGYKPGFYTPEQYMQGIDAIEECLQNGEHITHMEVVRRHRDGRFITCSASYTPVYDANGQFSGSVAIFHDITDKKLAEDKARNLAAIVAIADAGIVIRNGDGIIEEWNIGAESILGYTPEEALGRSPKFYMPEETHNRVDGFQARLKNGEHITHVEVVRKHKDGRLIVCSTSYTPIFDEQKNFLGSVAIFQDISEQKRIERALQEAVQTAEEASMAKSNFLARMSHEIRTPMNGIIGVAELAAGDRAIPSQTREYLNKISKSADGLLEIINDILDISKIESGKMTLEEIPTNLFDVLRNCESICLPRALEKNITLNIEAGPTIPKFILGDPTKLRQIFLNLLSNAIKFTDKGTVKLTVELAELDSGIAKLHFEVTDTGIGMTAKQMQKVFEPFVQADDSTTRKYGGTGIGLSIAKSMVELMGGTLCVESVSGVGSKFSFDIRFKAYGNANDSAEVPAHPARQEKPIFKGCVLVCEDNKTNQFVMSENLSKIGLDSVIAENGKIGVDLVKERMEMGEPFDLIFMDINMPVMDGLEASDKLKEYNNKTPIIALTANVMLRDVESYKNHGMEICLGKPFKARELWECLLKCLTPVKFVSMTDTGPPTGGSSTIIDRTIGLGQAVGDEVFYDRVLTNFANDNKATFKEFTDALSAGDYTLARRIVHTLKGVAGLIGATELQNAARDVEKALSGNDTSLSKHQTEILGTSLNAVLKELEPQQEPNSLKNSDD